MSAAKVGRGGIGFGGQGIAQAPDQVPGRRHGGEELEIDLAAHAVAEGQAFAVGLGARLAGQLAGHAGEERELCGDEVEVADGLGGQGEGGDRVSFAEAGVLILFLDDLVTCRRDDLHDVGPRGEGGAIVERGGGEAVGAVVDAGADLVAGSPAVEAARRGVVVPGVGGRVGDGVAEGDDGARDRPQLDAAVVVGIGDGAGGVGGVEEERDARDAGLPGLDFHEAGVILGAGDGAGDLAVDAGGFAGRAGGDVPIECELRAGEGREGAGGWGGQFALGGGGFGDEPVGEGEDLGEGEGAAGGGKAGLVDRAVAEAKID